MNGDSPHGDLAGRLRGPQQSGVPFTSSQLSHSDQGCLRGRKCPEHLRFILLLLPLAILHLFLCTHIPEYLLCFSPTEEILMPSADRNDVRKHPRSAERQHFLQSLLHEMSAKIKSGISLHDSTQLPSALCTSQHLGKSPFCTLTASPLPGGKVPACNC